MKLYNDIAQSQNISFAPQPQHQQLPQPQAPQQPYTAVSHYQQPQPTQTPQMGFKPDYDPLTTENLIKDLGLIKVFTGVNNHGAIFAYLYKDHLIQNNRRALITKPKKGWIRQEKNMYGDVPFIETSKYEANHTPIYEGEQTALYKLIEIVDNLGANTTHQPQQHQEPKRQIGFRMSKDDLINTILESADDNGKVIAKSKLINIRNRAECNLYKEAVTELQQEDILEYKNGYGYFLKEV